MQPPLEIHEASGRKILHFPATPTLVHHTTSPLTTTLRIIVVLLGALTLAGTALWFLAHTRLRIRRRYSKTFKNPFENAYDDRRSTEMMIFESDISIDMVMEGSEFSGTEFEDLSERASVYSMETILSSVSATKVTFDIDKLPALLKGGILDRRGRRDLQCDTSAFYDLNCVATGLTPLSGRVSAKKSITRPVFGFNFQEITPPVGSPLWNRKLEMPRPVCPGPFTSPPKWSG